MKLKHNIDISGVRPEISIGMIVADGVYKSFQSELVITSCVEGKHKARSKHYTGLAFDCRTSNVPKDQIARLVNGLKDALGPQFDVVLESDHIHVEFDPDYPVNLKVAA